MAQLLTDFRAQFLELTLQFLWHQWSALGVAGWARTDDPWIIDPEALFLVTTVFGRYEARLFDEMLDWLQTNGKRINLQRLRNLDDKRGIADRDVVAAVADVLGDRATLRKWKRVSNLVAEVIDRRPMPFFHSKTGEPVPVFGDPDERFSKYYLQRNRVELRGMSLPPNPNTPAAFLFKLRALIGVSARAEILAYLLTHESGHPHAIARRIGYFPKTVQNTLNEMELSGHVRSRQEGREKHFWVRPDEWRFLITWRASGENDDHARKEFPRWIDWGAVFSGLVLLWRPLARRGVENASRGVQSIWMREAMDKAGPAFAEADFARDFRATERHTGDTYLDILLEDLTRLLG